MARIENFPQELLDEHASWHMNMRMGTNARNGVDFLSFHREFLKKSIEWYRSQGFDTKVIRPWSSIPNEIKSHPRWNQRLQNAENRIVNDLDSFSSSEELGNFLLNTNLHGSVHVIGSIVYNDPDFGQITLSPQSTYFYNWHRLINQWWREFERR